jgi:hypothetical protein
VQSDHRRCWSSDPHEVVVLLLPGLQEAEIIWLQQHHPDLLERALAIERNARDSLTSVKGLGRSFSWDEYLNRLNHLPLFQIRPEKRATADSAFPQQFPVPNPLAASWY